MDWTPWLVGLVALELAPTALERWERSRLYQAARVASWRNGKPLLNIGCPRGLPCPAYPCGDVCLDLTAHGLRNCQAAVQLVGDVRDMSQFPDKAFGAVTCFHVLEHLPSVPDAERAVRELNRVAERVSICSPYRTHIWAQLHPEHHLWVDHQGDGTLDFEDRNR